MSLRQRAKKSQPRSCRYPNNPPHRPTERMGSVELERMLDLLNLLYDSPNRASICCNQKCQRAISVEGGRLTEPLRDSPYRA